MMFEWLLNKLVVLVSIFFLCSLIWIAYGTKYSDAAVDKRQRAEAARIDMLNNTKYFIQVGSSAFSIGYRVKSYEESGNFIDAVMYDESSRRFSVANVLYIEEVK